MRRAAGRGRAAGGAGPRRGCAQLKYITALLFLVSPLPRLSYPPLTLLNPNPANSSWQNRTY